MTADLIARHFSEGGCAVLAAWESRSGAHVVVSGDRETLSRFRFGNAEAWADLIAGAPLHSDGRIVVRVRSGKTGGNVNLLTPEQTARIVRGRRPADG